MIHGSYVGCLQIWLFVSAIPLCYIDHSAIHIARNLVFHERIMHIEIYCHLTRHHFVVVAISLPFVSFASQSADVFIKPHSEPRFRFLTDKL